MYQCQICGKNYSTKRALSLHTSNKHNIGAKEYYDTYEKIEGEDVCPICDGQTKFINASKGYHRYCSNKCKANSKEVRQKCDLTKTIKYGNSKYVNGRKASETWKNKSKEEILEIVEKRRATNKIEHGKPNYTNREKAIVTCIEKYGTKYYTNREKAIQTTLDKYGVECIFDLPGFHERIRGKYGHPMDDPILVQKAVNNRKKFQFNKVQAEFDVFLKVVKYVDEYNIDFKCKECDHEFNAQRQLIMWRLQENIHPCPKCCDLTRRSNKENSLYDFICENYGGTILTNVKNIISPYELDIYLPEINLGFEYNGIFWHCELKIPNNYHLKKTQLCENKGIHLIHIYGDDWTYKTEIVQSRVLTLLSKSKVIYARNCEYQKISNKDAKEFLDNNHLQGNCNSKYIYGLYNESELVSLISFGHLRRNLGHQNREGYELLRFCNKKGIRVLGGASKLFKKFVDEINPELIISYADRSWTFNNGKTLYDQLGFELVSVTKPNYYYIINKKRENRFKYRKSELVKQGYCKDFSEHEIMLSRKYYRIYNSGNLKYEWRKDVN